MIAELAWTFRWALAELLALTVDELQAWHRQAVRIQQAVHAAPGGAPRF